MMMRVMDWFEENYFQLFLDMLARISEGYNNCANTLIEACLYIINSVRINCLSNLGELALCGCCVVVVVNNDATHT